MMRASVTGSCEPLPYSERVYFTIVQLGQSNPLPYLRLP
jgi:hypothetical protein